MVGKKANLKLLVSKVREAGASVLKTTEFVQGQTARWGLVWSFIAQRKMVIKSITPGKAHHSFMLQTCTKLRSAADEDLPSAYFEEFRACNNSPILPSSSERRTSAIFLDESKMLSSEVFKGFHSSCGKCLNICYLLWMDTEATLEAVKCAFSQESLEPRNVLFHKVNKING